MKRVKWFFFFFCIFFEFAVCIISVCASQSLSIQGYPYQGGILFLKVKEALPEQFGICFWDKQVFPLARNGDILEVILPVSVEMKPGVHEVSASLYSPESGNSVLTRGVEIKPVEFSVQYLWLSKSQVDKYSHPSLDEEYNRIDKALFSYSSEKYWEGNFIWPCSGYVTTKFGLKRYVNGEPFGWHRGFDIACPWGTPVKASNNGKIVLAEENFKLHGKTVVIDHGRGLTSLYIHLSGILVKEGDMVKKGDSIGGVGATGVSTGPHLHWAVYAFGTPFSPKCLFKMIE